QQIARPLDFAAVTDHAELLGEVSLCEVEGSEAWGSWQCRLYRAWPRAAYYFFNFRAAQGQRLGFCGEDGALCRGAATGPWREIRDAAAAANDAGSDCRFTSFIGYEWTGSAGTGQNLHRNVLFRGEAVPEAPVSFIEAGSPERLWDALDEACGAPGPDCQWLAIPHNPNLSAGSMFRDTQSDGSPFTRENAERRAGAEPLLEIMQHKGASECVPGAGEAAVAADESCSFELLPYDSFSGQIYPWAREAPTHATGYLRDVLRQGLRISREAGADPYRFGVIGSTDTHLGIAGGASEATFLGHGGAGEPARDGVPAGLPDRPEFGPGGLALVWAEENTREAIFDALRRRETYASSGTRPQLRFFGGWDYPEALCSEPDLVATGYARGVPMGGELQASAAAGRAPVFVVAGMRDPVEGEGIERLEIIKGWIDSDGRPGESRVAVARAAAGSAGADALCAVWRDEDWQEGQQAWYYARLLEAPVARWSARRCEAAGVRCEDGGAAAKGYAACCESGHAALIQERAWSSPIWLRGPATPGQ
ncbi:MAG: DUF3604 domain-containing protein, partial [Gammaproteobacteria bacterium]